MPVFALPEYVLDSWLQPIWFEKLQGRCQTEGERTVGLEKVLRGIVPEMKVD
jgi:hypothetical protein